MVYSQTHLCHMRCINDYIMNNYMFRPVLAIQVGSETQLCHMRCINDYIMNNYMFRSVLAIFRLS